MQLYSKFENIDYASSRAIIRLESGSQKKKTCFLNNCFSHRMLSVLSNQIYMDRNSALAGVRPKQPIEAEIMRLKSPATRRDGHATYSFHSNCMRFVATRSRVFRSLERKGTLSSVNYTFRRRLASEFPLACHSQPGAAAAAAGCCHGGGPGIWFEVRRRD